MNHLHEANRKRWNAASVAWARMHDERGTWKICHRKPELVLVPLELKLLRAISGKEVCVLGSGDNLVAFALAGMGAKVTSVDISENQLAVAAQRAQELMLDIKFIRADICDLSVLFSNAYDLVYTGGHVAVWVSDLKKYYRESVRILKDHGLFIVHEYHPFRRVWKQGVDHLEVAYDYYDRGPFQFQSNEEIMGPGDGAFETYEFHWSVSDLINGMIEAGCLITHAEEHGTHVGDWEGAPMQGLPEFLLLVGRKQVA